MECSAVVQLRELGSFRELQTNVTDTNRTTTVHSSSSLSTKV